MKSIFTAFLFALALPTAPVLAQSLSDSELDKIHAGYLSANGMEFSLGAVMTSYVNGNLALTSTLSINDTGTALSQQTGSGAQPLDNAALAGLKLDSTGGAGVVVPGAGGGATAFVHTFTADQLSNMVVNNASGLNITQNTGITVTVPNLAALQSSMALAGLTSRLQAALGQQQLGSH